MPLHAFGGAQTLHIMECIGRNEKLCLSREEGGIGFEMIHEFNLALLAKKLWRLVQFPNSFVARVLRGK